jgi:hypothetical protein
MVTGVCGVEVISGVGVRGRGRLQDERRERTAPMTNLIQSHFTCDTSTSLTNSSFDPINPCFYCLILYQFFEFWTLSRYNLSRHEGRLVK